MVSNVFESMQEDGWVPFGSFSGNDVLALGNERFLYNRTTDSGVTISNGFSYDVPRRVFASKSDAKDIFNRMVMEIYSSKNVPDLLSIPLIYNWSDVLSDSESDLEKTEMDRRRRATFDVMPEEVKYTLWKSYYYHSNHIRDYTLGQKKWVADSAWFKGMVIGRELSPEECAEAYIASGISLEFRINFALQHPDWMERMQETIDLKQVNLREPYILSPAA